jgi:hypothetical protein
VKEKYVKKALLKVKLSLYKIILDRKEKVIIRINNNLILKKTLFSTI